MKIILSRKGFDTSSGGCANPILEDGRLVSLPIPDPASPIRYGDISCDGLNLGTLVNDLTSGRLCEHDRAHLDPDLQPGWLDRDPSWRPLFGQAGAAAGHLTTHQVGPGDLFLFFGWFRPARRHKNRFIFPRREADRHIIYGWLQVDHQVTLDGERPFPFWMGYHPHCHGDRGKGNVLFVARKQLALPQLAKSLPGAGVFKHVLPELILTRPQHSRTHWQLPPWFHPRGRASHLSYHADPGRWQQREDAVWLRSVSRGQEFVLDGDHYPEALGWAAGLLAAGHD